MSRTRALSAALVTGYYIHPQREVPPHYCGKGLFLSGFWSTSSLTTLAREHECACKAAPLSYYRAAQSLGILGGRSSGVERNLAKVEVVSSNLIARSTVLKTVCNQFCRFKLAPHSTSLARKSELVGREQSNKTQMFSSKGSLSAF